MALTDSNMLPLGTKAPNFFLTDVVSKELIELQGKPNNHATVILFMCNHCPYVIHLINGIARIANKYQKKGVRFIAINSNDVIKYPADSPDKMVEFAIKNNIDFPYCFDETQEIAKAYDAACTPDFYVFDRNLLLTYRGRFDSSRPSNNIPITGIDLTNALDSTLNNQLISQLQYPSSGCNIKWK